MDNLFSSYCAIEGLIESVKAENWGSDGRVSMIALWDNEEVGSVSAYGAESNFIEAVIERVAVALKKDDETATEAYQQTLAASFLLSCDMGHAAHPRFVHSLAFSSRTRSHLPVPVAQLPRQARGQPPPSHQLWPSDQDEREAALRHDFANDVCAPPDRQGRRCASAGVRGSERHGVRFHQCAPFSSLELSELTSVEQSVLWSARLGFVLSISDARCLVCTRFARRREPRTLDISSVRRSELLSSFSLPSLADVFGFADLFETFFDKFGTVDDLEVD